MDESVVAAIQELANALAGLGSWQQQLVSMTVLLVVAAAGSFFGAYLKTRATNAAMSDDLDDIKRQLRETTDTTETIRSQISKRGELHSLRIKKLEELMVLFLEAQRVYSEHIDIMKRGESPARLEQDPMDHIVMLSKFYFPELSFELPNFCHKWWIFLGHTRADLSTILAYDDPHTRQEALFEWSQIVKKPLLGEKDAKRASRTAEALLVETMKKLLNEQTEAQKQADTRPDDFNLHQRRTTGKVPTRASRA
ncbi:hypothetical protein [Achromobacter sp. GbtcB20]|uniref:hypothetical protein n=1 Tax=Achromobacter sp. GbtcB20 TaxID=2824765 RepID=UPI0012669F13|nr:hypothetical protein [Achromobacter sp. GbtcB20]